MASPAPTQQFDMRRCWRGADGAIACGPSGALAVYNTYALDPTEPDSGSAIGARLRGGQDGVRHRGAKAERRRSRAGGTAGQVLVA
eukprot:462193-Pleurochrysis_carterae.AAC.3